MKTALDWRRAWVWRMRARRDAARYLRGLQMETALERRRARARRMRSVHRVGSWVLAVGGTVALVVGLPRLVWRVPYLLDKKYLDPANAVGQGGGLATLISGTRTAVVASAAAIGAGVALVYTIRNYRLSRRGQVTERFTKALERLGSDERYVRIGGVLALEQIVQDAPEQATHAAQVLSHFVRDRTPATSGPRDNESTTTGISPLTPPAPPTRPDADVQVALTALTRPESRTYVDDREYLDLRTLHLAGADLSGADLTGAYLFRANLTGADLSGANLTDAYLSGANLTDARLYGADLTGARLNEANLTDARLNRANLTRANLSWANLTRARLGGANLTRAFLDRANPTRADLERAILTDVTGLTMEQVRSAYTDADTVLPDYLRPPTT